VAHIFQGGLWNSGAGRSTDGKQILLSSLADVLVGAALSFPQLCDNTRTNQEKATWLRLVAVGRKCQADAMAAAAMPLGARRSTEMSRRDTYG
jgi:hypothetical protein